MVPEPLDSPTGASSARIAELERALLTQVADVVANVAVRDRDGLRQGVRLWRPHATLEPVVECRTDGEVARDASGVLVLDFVGALADEDGLLRAIPPTHDGRHGTVTVLGSRPGEYKTVSVSTRR